MDTAHLSARGKCKQTKTLKQTTMEYNKPRSIVELLKLILEYKEVFRYGLCHWVTELRNSNLITYEEMALFLQYIRNNKPSPWSLQVLLNRPRSCETCSYWRRGRIKPRIKWVEKHIKLNQ